MRAPNASAPRRQTGSVVARRPARATTPEPARLVCQAGPAAGQEYVLAGDELTLGRAAENPVALPDTSVSRKHALVRSTGGGWAISDLGSGNGTMLNGEVIADEIELNEGDVIALGDTELRFEAGVASAVALDDSAEELQVAAPSTRRPPVRTARTDGISVSRGRPVRTRTQDASVVKSNKRKTLVRVGAVMVVVLALAVGAKAVQKRNEAIAKARQNAAEQHKGELSDMFKEAKAAVKQRKWVEAKAKLLEIQETDPEFEPRQIGNYLTIADKEIPNQAVIDQAMVAISGGELGRAFGLLKGVKASPQADDAVRAARDAIDAKVIERLGEARALVGTRDLPSQEKAKAIAEDILAVREDDREAAELKRSADNLIFAIKNPTVAPTPIETPWREVQSRFKNGDSTGALSLAQSCANRQPACRELDTQIREWDQKSKRVEDLNENELIALFDLDRKIAGGVSSDQSRPIRTQLVSKLFVKASQLKTTQNWSRAIDYARKVLQADPNHTGAQALISDARNQARDVYLRAYQLKDTSQDEAAKLFKEVITMTPADDEYNVKARARLKDLQSQ